MLLYLRKLCLSHNHLLLAWIKYTLPCPGALVHFEQHSFVLPSHLSIMKAPFPSFVPEWHNASYPAIDPTLPAHSHAGQTVIITGAGTGIGKATALAYAAAAAERVVLIGRREAKLAQTKTLIAERAPTVKVETYSASVTQIADLKGVADRVGGWDVMVLNAASLTAPKTIEESDPNDWWETIEVSASGCRRLLCCPRPNSCESLSSAM